MAPISINKHSKPGHLRYKDKYAVHRGIVWDVCINLNVVRLITGNPLAETSLCISDKSLYFVPISSIHNGFMYVRFGAIRNTKTWNKSMLSVQ